MDMIVSSPVISDNPTVTDTIDSSPDVSCDPSSSSDLQSGENTVTCTATDEAGNSDMCTYTITLGNYCFLTDANTWYSYFVPNI